MTDKYKYFTKENSPSLEDVLVNREKRIEKISSLEKEYEGKAIICFKLNIPGPQKVNDEILKIFHLGKEQIKKSIASTNILYESSKSDFTGPEYFIVSNIDAYDLKKKMLDIEENSYFGRLYDIDVIYKDENITRKMIGGPSRKCFLCDNDAKACARSRNHSVDEMIIWIEAIIDDYQGDLWKKER